MFYEASIRFLLLFCTASTTNKDAPPVLPRVLALGNPDHDSVQMSHDGKYVSYLAPWNNILNLYVRKIPGSDAPKRLTNETKRGLQNRFIPYQWMHDNQTIVYARDNDGDENSQLYAINVVTGQNRVLVNKPRAQARILATSERKPDLLMIALNDRDLSHHDVHALNVTTGQHSLIVKDEEYKSFLFDKDLNVRMAFKENDDAGISIFTVSNGSDMKLWRKFGPEDGYSVKLSHSDDTRTAVYWFDIGTINRDLAALVKENLTNRESNASSTSRKRPKSRIRLSLRILSPENHSL